ncbi:MAG: efflux RND transporter permease subunit [Pseudomonadota bacterium]|nr:efflux RND transporter permease subunit [Pseudomonadota bacterium]
MNFRISAWAIRNPIPVALMFIALTIAGLVAYPKLLVKHFPNIAFPAVMVTVTQNGAAPSEVENQISRPVENAIAGITNVKHVQTTATLGASSTMIEFELGSDLQKATDDVRTAIDRTRPQLPPTIDPPQVQRLDIDSAPILTYAVSSNKLSGVDLSWFIDDTVARTLQAEKGVAQVGRVGGSDREINVVLNPDRMAAFGVTAPQVNDALRQFNTDEPGGRADIGAQEQTVRVLGSATTVDKLRNTSIPAAGHFVRLSDVADIGDGQAEQRGFARLNGAPTVAFQVNKTKDSSDVAVEERINKAVEKLAKAHPEVTITKVVSTVQETRASFEATQEVLLEGMALAALVVLLFLREWRATAITAFAMPLSLIPTFAVMLLLGFSLNVVTLLALTLVIGILVDDAIVEIENIEKRVERGQTPYRAALIGADSIGLAVVATTSTIVAVFLPVSFMPGIPGQFFKEFGLTVSVAVLFSLLVARFATPPMAAYFLKAKHAAKPPKPLGGFYGKSLDWALHHRWFAAILGGLIFFVSIGVMISPLLPKGFQPISDSGYLYLQLEGPPGVTREGMDRAVRDVTRRLLAYPDVQTVFAQTGSSSSGGAGFNGPGGSDLRDGTVTVVLKDHRTHKTDAFKKLIRPMLRQVPDIRIVTQGSFGAADVNIVLSSEDTAALDATQLELEKEMRGLSIISDVRPSPPPAGPELVIKPKLDEAARLGVTSAALANVLRVATIGDIDANVAKFSEGKRRIPIRVRLSEDDRQKLSVIGNLQVPTASGKLTTLDSVADINFQAGPAKIVRYQREREAIVEADLNGVVLGTALAAVNKLPVMKHLPPTVKQAQIGDAEAMIELFGGMIMALLTGIGLIFGVLILLFRSFFKPIVILAALPLCLIGAVIGLLVGRMEIDMPAMIGFLMLMGLAAKNSILLVEYAIEDERAGQSRLDALKNACRERARPIIMTTMAMAAGMLPTALGIGQGSEFRQPMAIAVIGGLITSTALSLVLVPVVYEIVDDFERWLTPKFARLITPRAPGDDAPIAEGEETLVTDNA